MKKIIHYIPCIDRSCGGTTEYIRLLAEKLGQQSELHVVTHTSQHPVEMEHCLVHYIHKNIFGAMKQEWMALLNDVQPDIVHVHLCGAMLYVAQAAEECNVPLRFYTLHSNPFRQTGEILTAIQSAFTSQSFTALCLNNLQYNQAKDYYHIKKYEILRNGINFQKIRKIAIPKKNARKLFELDESDFVISCVGRLDPIKNYSFMLDVMNLVLKKQPKAKLIFAGDGSERQKLETKAVTLGIRQNIKFLGNMQNVIPVYCASDVFCLTSINEASSLVLLEAQAVNVYSVVSAGVPEESIVSDKVCHMKEGSTVDEWANAVLNENFIGKPVCTEEECDVNNATKNLKAIYMKYYKELKSNEK